MSRTLRARAAAALLLLAATLTTGACTTPSTPSGSGVPIQTPAAGSEGTAVVGDSVQRIAVDLTTGEYVPSVIVAKPGVPLEITFGQGQGCLASVLIPDFGVDQDLTQGGAVIKLPAMEAGEYPFSCGMEMVFGTIVVR